MFGISLNSALLGTIAVAWLLYPIAGAARVSVDIRRGKRPVGSGFSFLPELIVFPVLFFVVAKLLDLVVAPWGTWIVIGTSLAMTAAAVAIIGRAYIAMRSRVDGEQ